MPTRDAQADCTQTQLNFVEQYVYAKSGDIPAMGSTAASFLPTPRDTANYDRFNKVGAPVNPIQSCAWRLVIASSSEGMAQDMARRVCGALPEQDQSVARRRSEALLQELQTARLPTPSADWYPYIPGYNEPRSAALKTGAPAKLDHTVTPLH